MVLHASSHAAVAVGVVLTWEFAGGDLHAWSRHSPPKWLMVRPWVEWLRPADW